LTERGVAFGGSRVRRPAYDARDFYDTRGVPKRCWDTRSCSGREDRLAKLADLKERGVLSDDEFAAEKAKILGES
jgi:Short C-terminal domain